MNDTTNQTDKRSPNSGPLPRHAGVTREWPTVGYTPRRLRPEPDEATVPVPVDPAHPNANSPHIWPAVNVRPSPSPVPRPPQPPVELVPPVFLASRRDWRDRLSALPWPARIAGIIVLVAVLVVAAVAFGVIR